VRLVLLFLLLALAMAAPSCSACRRRCRHRLARRGAPAGGGLRGPPGRRDRQPAQHRARPGPGAAPARGRAHRGPQVNWAATPRNPDQERRWNDANRWKGDEPRLLERTTADGHRIHFAERAGAGKTSARVIGWATLAVLLLLTALAYLRVRRLLRPLDDIRAGACALARATSPAHPRAPPARPDELGELAATINTMGGDIHQMLDAKRALLLAISHELRSPLTRARLNTELLPETPDVRPRAALLRDLGEMRDLITDLLESERLASPPRRAAPRAGGPGRAGARGDRAGPAWRRRRAVKLTARQRPAHAGLDRTRMRLLLRNLLDNALRHSVDRAAPARN
jgi:signal transduction histidine kinase